MLRLCMRNLINQELKRGFKSYKYHKLKHKEVLALNLSCVQHNPTFSHVDFLNLHRNFHTGLALRARIFKDVENEYAFGILQSLPITDRELLAVKSPNKTIASLNDFNGLLDQNWRSKSGTEVVEGFKSALGYCKDNNITVSDERFDKLVDGMMDRVQDLTDSELSDLLSCLAEYPLCDSYTSHNFHDMWSALDDVCCWRIAKWPNETLFQFAEHWYRLHLGKLSDFVFNFIDRMHKRIDSLSKNQLLHILFYMKIHKRRKLDFEYHYALDKYIGDMSTKEMALAAMTFTRFETKIKLETTVAHMIRKLTQELPSADEICVRKLVEVRSICKYVPKLIEKMAKQNLNKTQLVHAFFYINVYRKCYVDASYESALQKHIDQFSADEMAVIAMGFFKSQSRVKLKFLLSQMAEQIKKERHTVHEITLTAVLKVLRYSSHVLLADQLMDLLDHIVPEIDRLSILCCIHIALLGTTLQFFHEKSLEKVSQKVLDNLEDPSQVRLKDMERLLVPLIMFDFNPKTSQDIFDSIRKELHKEERRKESAQYPRCLASALNFLSFRNIYVYELIDRALDKDSYTEVYGKNAKVIPRDLFSLDVCIEVECPDYRGNRLDEAFRRKVAKWHVEYTPSWDQHKKLTAADKFHLDVIDTVAKVVQGHQNLRADHVLPNYVKSDIIVCQDGDTFVQPSGLDCYKLGDVMRPPSPSLNWFAVVPVNWNNTIRNTSKPVGLVSMKSRQLRAIGYTPVLVIWNEFKDLDDKGKIQYVKDKIRQSRA